MAKLSIVQKLKQNKNASLEKFLNADAKMNAPAFEKDKRFWQLKIKEDKNGYAVIRFLPSKNEDDDSGLGDPFVRLYVHNFKGKNGWYVENCLSTLGKPDPVLEYNSTLWDTQVEKNIEIAKQQKRKQQFISNILVIKDPAAPENEGKVFLYKYGVKIWEKQQALLKPTFPDDAPVDVYDYFAGCNFKLKAITKDNFLSYENSAFDAPTKAGTDAEIEALYEQTYDLREFLKPENFGTYEALKAKFEKVIGRSASTAPSARAVAEVDDEIPPFEMKAKNARPQAGDDEDESGSADNLAKFRKLLDDDDD